MVGLGEAGRSGSNTYRGIRALTRIVHQRALLDSIRYAAVLEALYPDHQRNDPIPPHIDQAVKLLCDELDHTPIPYESSRGFVKGAIRITREHITHGIRFPKWRKGDGTTFFQRAAAWGSKAAASEKGLEALDMAGAEPGPEAAALFGKSFSVALYGILISSGVPSDGQNSLRLEMANEIMHGVADDVRIARYRLLQDGVTSLAAGTGAWITSYLGFNQTMEDALEFGGASLFVAASVTTARHLSGQFLSEKQQEARRQTRNWMLSLHTWMVAYVVWGRAAFRGGEYHGIDQLTYMARALAAQEAHIPELPRDETIQEDLVLLIENSERAADSELTTALMRLQGVLRWRSEHLGTALGNLISVVQNVPEITEEIGRPLPPVRGGTDPPPLPPGGPGDDPPLAPQVP
ncbi:hypothetical protein ACFVIM_02675 [Streptomyces sp. NPDC057638]|uniref:hypothetical protein n=1 Tax=Streptomyces sp. NPDC057638 TaxID=3346190 RepID=UPI00368BADD1